MPSEGNQIASLVGSFHSGLSVVPTRSDERLGRPYFPNKVVLFVGADGLAVEISENARLDDVEVGKVGMPGLYLRDEVSKCWL